MKLIEITNSFFGIEAMFLTLMIISIVIAIWVFFIMDYEFKKYKKLKYGLFIYVIFGIITTIMLVKSNFITKSYKIEYFISNFQEAEVYLQKNKEQIKKFDYENDILIIYTKSLLFLE